MSRTVSLTIVLLAGLLCCAAGSDEKKIPAAAKGALRKFQQAVSQADTERSKTVDRARIALVADLKAAQKAALQRNDVDGATACAELAKENGLPAAKFAGSSVKGTGGFSVRFNEDGTVTHSDKQYTGRWIQTGDRTVAVFYNHGWVEAWDFDAAGKGKGTSYRQDHTTDVTIESH